MTFAKDKIVRRNANGSFLHHGAPMPLTRDAAPTGSEVGGIGPASLGYREYNRTMHPLAQGKVGGTDPQREDGALRSVLCSWDVDCETEIVEQDGRKYLLMWTPLQSGEGNPEGATTSAVIKKSATTMADPEKTFADPPVGPREAARDAHRQMFDRITDLNVKKPLVARRALEKIRQSAGALESINATNRDFWGKK